MTGNPLLVNVTQTADIRGVGIGSRSQGGTPQINRNLTKIVGIVGAFQWGAEGLVSSPSGGYDFTNGKQIMETLFPFAPDDCYNELADLPLGKVRFYNVRGSDATLGTVTLDDASNADSLVVTARYASVYTDKIKITVTANATTSTSRDVKVDVYAPDGTTVMVTNTYAAVQAADGTVTDPSDPYVTFAKKSGATTQAAVQANVALTAGSLGTLSAARYGLGLTAFSTLTGPDIIVPIGVAAATCDALNELVQTAADSDGGYGKTFIPATEIGLVKADALAAAALIRSRAIRYPWPETVRSVSYALRGYSTGPTNVTTAPGAAIACAIQNVDPWTPAAMRYAERSFRRVVSLPSTAPASQSDVADLLEGGVMTISGTTNYGFVPHKEVCTGIDTDTSLPYDGSTVRYVDQVKADLSSALESDLLTPLDLNLSTGDLGPNTRGIVAKIVAYFEREKREGHIVASINTTDGSASPAYTVDPFGSATPQDIGNGLWSIDIAFRKTANADFILLNYRHGTFINIQKNG